MLQIGKNFQNLILLTQAYFLTLAWKNSTKNHYQLTATTSD